MSQLPGNMSLTPGERVDAPMTQDTDVSSEVLPSAGHRSGLTPAVRQHLDEQFRASGSADTLVRELRAQIAELDSRPVSEDDPDHVRLQAERALLVAQVSYVEDELALHGVGTARRATTERAEWQDSASARPAGEPIARGSRRVKVYNSTPDR